MTPPMDRRDVVVLTGGDPVVPGLVGQLPAAATVIAADSGLAVATALDLPVHLVVGDLDSVDTTQLARARAAGASVEQHPTDKDATDLALALDAALALAPTHVTVIGGHGGRLDHLLANVLLLADDRYAAMRITARMGRAVVAVIWEETVLQGEPGDLVSLLPAHGAAHGVSTEGLLYPLSGDTLAPGSTRGISNELSASTATVRVADGVLLAVMPGEPGTHLLRPGGRT